MKRKCIKFDVIPFIKDLPELRSSKIEIWLDEKNAFEILDFINKKKKNGNYINRDKFRLILNIALSGKYNFDFYDKEEVSAKAKYVTSMKFKRSKSNYRIGCKEYSLADKKIIMVCLFLKTSQKNDKKIKQIYETIGGYEYEF